MHGSVPDPGDEEIAATRYFVALKNGNFQFLK